MHKNPVLSYKITSSYTKVLCHNYIIILQCVQNVPDKYSVASVVVMRGRPWIISLCEGWGKWVWSLHYCYVSCRWR